MAVGSLASRDAVAAQLGDLAEHRGLASRRDELKGLADALRGLGDGDLEPWTELDLVQAFGRPESVYEAVRTPPEKPLWGWLEAGIGALVFVPLLLTWFGLTRASSAYETLTGADPRQAARPFLQLWQTGFDGHLTGWFTFGHVAGTATGAILLLLVLAAVHGVRGVAAGRAEDEARRAGDQLLARLLPVLTRAQLLLNEEKLGSPGRFAAELTKAASGLAKMSSKAVKAQEALERATEQVAGALEEAERRLAGVTAAVRPLHEAADRIEGAVRDSGTALTGALGEIRTVNAEVRDELDRAGDRVEDALHTLAASQRAFTTSTEVAADVSGRTLERLGEVAESAARAVHASGDAADGLAEQTGALREAAERFAELTVRLEELRRRDESKRRERARRRAEPRDAVQEALPDELPDPLVETR